MSSLTDNRQTDRYRTTIYLEEEDLASLDELKAYFRRRHRRQTDRSQLIREAIRRYHEELVTPGRSGQETAR